MPRIDYSTNASDEAMRRMQARFIEEAIRAWDYYRDNGEGRLASYEDFLRGYVAAKWWVLNRLGDNLPMLGLN